MVTLLESSSESKRGVVQLERWLREDRAAGHSQWASKNCPGEYRYILILGLSPTTSPPLCEVDHCQLDNDKGQNADNAPQLGRIATQESLLESRLGPQAVGEPRVVDLVAVVHPDGVAALGLARGRDERQLAEKGDVFPAERAREEGPQHDNLVLHDRL